MRNEACLEKIEWTVKHCGMRRDHADECIKAREFMKENPHFGGFSVKGVLPLIREQDPEIKAKVISLVESAGKEKVMNYGTESKMKKAIARYKEVEPEELKEKPIKKLWSKVEQAEYAQEVVRTFIANGVDPAVIRELIVKAIGVVEQE